MKKISFGVFDRLKPQRTPTREVETVSVTRPFIKDAESAADIICNSIQSGDYTEVEEKIEQLISTEEDSERYLFPPAPNERGFLAHLFSCSGTAAFLYIGLIALGLLRYSTEYKTDGILFLILVIVVLSAKIGRIVKTRFDRAYYQRYESYANVLKFRRIETVDDLALVAKTKKAAVIKDLKRAIRECLIPEGHFGRKHFLFMISDDLYRDYLSRPDAYDRYYKKDLEERLLRKERSPEVEEFIHHGQEYVQSIRHSNDQIHDERITKKLNCLEQTVAAIVHEVDINPRQVNKLSLFMGYYLPTTQKLLDSYIKLSGNTVKGSPTDKTLTDIEKTIDLVNHAFEKLLERFYQELSVETAGDITALETLIRQEGLSSM